MLVDGLRVNDIITILVNIAALNMLAILMYTYITKECASKNIVRCVKKKELDGRHIIAAIIAEPNLAFGLRFLRSLNIWRKGIIWT